MYFDAMTAAAVAEECQLFAGGRVQNVLHVDDLAMGLEIYAKHQRHYMLVSAHARRSCVYLSNNKLRRGLDKPTPLLLLLRKYVRDGRLVKVEQPPFERVIIFSFEHIEPTTLYVEAMGRHANVILVDAAGKIMDSVKRVNEQMSRVRQILPGLPYTPPPPQVKLSPDELDETCLSDFFLDTDPKRTAWRTLVSGIKGTSPLLAQEVIYRATGHTDTRAGDIVEIEPVLSALNELWDDALAHRWHPGVALDQDQITAYAPYVLTQYAVCHATDTVSDAIEQYEHALATQDAYGPAKTHLLPIVKNAQQRAQARYEALQKQLIPQEELDTLRLNGEMIWGYVHAIRPRQTMLEATLDPESPPLKIPLDPKLSAVENAQAYFKRYEKAKAAAADLPKLLAQAKLELAYLDQLATDLSLASNWPEINEVKSALGQAGYTTGRQAKMQKGQPLRIEAQEGVLIWVGKSARQNHTLTFRRAGSDDLWFHAVDAAGAHVIIQHGGREVFEDTVQRAAELAAYYSSRRAENRVLVAWTARKYVRPIRGARPGQVTYRHEETMWVVPRHVK